MTYGEFFIKWLRSPYAVREETMNDIILAYQRGEYDHIDGLEMLSLKHLLCRMIEHQEVTTRKRIQLNLPLK